MQPSLLLTRLLSTLAAFFFAALPLLAAPANDHFENAQVLSGNGGSISGSSIGATGQPGEPGHWFGYGSTSVWYRWTPSVSGTAQFNTVGSGFDTLLAVYGGQELSALSAIAQNDDSDGALSSRVIFSATAGTTYRIAVAGYANQTGSIVLNWALTPPAVPPVITSSAVASGKVGEPLALAISASNSPHAFTATGLPPGVSLNPATGVFSGRPTQAGVFPVQVSATNSAGVGYGTISLSIAKGRAEIRWGNLNAVYDGTAKETSATTVPADLALTLAYAGGSPPVHAGNHSVQATIQDANYEGTSSATLTIAKAPATVSLAGLTQTYDGSPKSATATTAPAGLTVRITYDGRPTLPVEPGNYAVVATIDDPDHAGLTTGTLTISKITATVAIGGLTKTYNGSGQSATATTTPPGLNVTFTYAGSPSAPVAAGSYPVVATIQDAHYQGIASATLTIGKAPAGVVLGTMERAYDGSPKSPTATTIPAGLGVAFTFSGSPTPPTAVGSYPVTATITSPNHSGSASGTFVITKRAATISFSGLSQVYDGTPREVAVTTSPPGLAVTLQYPQGTPPTAAGQYQVWATVQDTNYQASSSAILVVAKAPAEIQLGGLQTVYNGTAKPPVITTVPAGLKVAVHYNNGYTPPTTAGNYVVYASIDEPNYKGSTSAPLVIAKAPATVTLGNLSATYDGERKIISATTTPAGITVHVLYNGNQLGPIDVGSYPVVATISHTNYTGSASGTLTISKGTATVTLGGLNAIYNGSPKYATATTVPGGLNVTFTYDGGTTAPTALGSYAVTGTVNSPSYAGSASGTLVIRKPVATMALGDLAQVYNGAPRPVTVTTQPSGLASIVTYNGSTTPPVLEGNYAVVATLNEPTYEPASVSGTLIISAFPEPYVFTTLAGTNSSGRVEGSGNEARFYQPSGIAVATDGTVYVADTENNAIRKITQDGVTSLFAGSATGLTGTTDGTGPDARFNSPRGIAIDAAGNLFVADSDNYLIRKITPAGVVTTVAGLAGTSGNTNGNGTAARFTYPNSLAFDAEGNLYLTDNHAVRKITPGGDVTTFAGTTGSVGSTDATGTTARFRNPAGIAVHQETGMIYVADGGNRTIRAITPAGVVTTFAGLAGSSGTVNGVGSAARFTGPQGLAADALGNLFVGDGVMIRKVSFEGEATSVGGAPSTAGYGDGYGSSARFNSPAALAIAANGALFIAESGNHTIRQAVTAITTGPPAIFNPATFAGTLNSAWPAFLIAATGGPTAYSATGLPSGLSLNPSTGAITGTPTVPGTYTVTLGATNGSGTTTRTITLVVQKVSASVFLSGMTVTYDGNPKSVTTSTVPSGLTLSISYNGSTTPPTAVGTYAVTAIVNDPVYRGTASGTFAIVKPVATLALSNLRPAFTGNPLPVTVTTTPPGLPVAVTYNGSLTVPSAPGAYAVVATLTDDYYQPASATGTLEVSRYATPYTFTTLAGRAGGSGAEDGPRTSARFNRPSGIARDGTGNLYIADTTNHTIRKIATDGTVTTIAGTARSAGSTDGVGTAARFSSPRGIAVASSGIIYVADTGNSTIRKIATDGTVTTLAGYPELTGTTNGTGSSARFSAPEGVAVSSTGDIYVADTANYAIRKVTPAGVVMTFAGLAGTPAFTDATGTAARFKNVAGLVFDTSGNLYVTDRNNYRIRKITSAAVVTTLAGGNFQGTADGTGTSASFYYPCGIAIDPSGNLIVADENSRVIRKVTPAGVVTTIAGTALSSGISVDGTGSAARFSTPAGVAVNAAGTMFVTDGLDYSIRTISPAAVVTTYAGRYTYGNMDGNGVDARFFTPQGTVADASGNLYVADKDNRTIRKITPSGVVSTLAGLAGSSGTTDGTGSAARFTTLRGLAIDSSGNLFAADNNLIRKITPAGVVTTFATNESWIVPVGLAFDSVGNLFVTSGGSGGPGVYKFTPGGQRTVFVSGSTLISSLNLSGTVMGLSGLAIDGADQLYVVDAGNQVVLKITSAGVATIHAGTVGATGSADGQGTAARLWFNIPSFGSQFAGIAADAAGNVYVADTAGHTIRHISPEGEVSTIAGRPTVFGLTDGLGAEALFGTPSGVALDASGNLLVATAGHHTIRRGSAIPAMPVITSVTNATGRVGVSFSYRITASGAATGFSASGLPAGLNYNATTGIISGTPQEFGTFAVTISAQNTAGNGSAVLQLTISKPVATLALGGLAQEFDGQPRPATATTTPAGLATAITYNGSTSPPYAPGSYTVVATITNPGYEAEAASGTLVISTTLKSYTFSTLAGSPSSPGSADGSGNTARFDHPRGLAVNAGGDLFVADVANSVIRKVTPAGVVTTFAGSPGIAGSADGQGSAARFTHPHGVAADGSGNVYVADTNNCTVRKITPAGLVTTLAGAAGSPGSNDGTGSSARFTDLQGIAVTPTGTVYVADTSNGTIRKITPAGVVTTFAGTAGQFGTADGTGPAARFGEVASLAIDRLGNLYAADLSSNTIRKITPEAVVTTFAGSPGATGTTDGTGSAARFNTPAAVSVDAGGNVYVADLNNGRIRKITAVGVVTTMAGVDPYHGSQDGTGAAAHFRQPIGIAVGATGIVYVADYGDHTIRAGHLETGLPAPEIIGAVAATGTYGTPFADYPVVATGSPFSYAAASLPPGLSMNPLTGVISGTPTAAGEFTVILSATNSSGTGSASVVFSIAKLAATLELGSLTPRYDGSPRAASVTTVPAGLPVTITYDGQPTPPVEIGSYPVTATINAPNHSGSASGTLVIGKGLATLTFDGIATTYDGSAKSVGITISPAGLNATVAYDGLPDQPVAAGEYLVEAAIDDDLYEGSATATLVISPATVPVILGGLNAVFDGSPKSATATTDPAGLAITFTYNGGSQAPVAPGSYEVIATVVDDNHVGSATAQMILSPAPALVTLGGMATTYDGTQHPVSVTTQPPGLTVAVTYDGNPQPPVHAGSYHVVATITDPSHAGSAAGTLEIARAAASISLAGLDASYDGSPKSVTATTVPAGLATAITYNGSATPPSEPGSCDVVATITDVDHMGATTGTLQIEAEEVEIELGGLDVTYDGNSKQVAVTTSPADLPVTITYDGNPQPPVNAGSYNVTATVQANGHAGSATAVLLIRKAAATVSFDNVTSEYDGTAKPVYAITTPAGLPMEIRYDGSTAAPVGAGTHAVTATVSDPNWTGSATGSVVISALPATVSIGGLLHDQDGAPKAVTSTTVPPGLPVTVTYNGLATVPSAEGSYTVVATIADGNHQGSASAVMVIRPTLEGYQESVFTPAELANPAISGPNADPDGDGISNLLEYAFAMDPKSSNAGELPQAELEDEHLTLTYIRRRNVVDLEYEMETSDDMVTWHSGKGQTQIMSIIPLDDTREQVTVRDVEAKSENPARYVRIKVLPVH